MKAFKNIFVVTLLFFVLVSGLFAGKLQNPDTKFFFKFGLGAGNEYTANNLAGNRSVNDNFDVKDFSDTPVPSPHYLTSIMYPSDSLFIEFENMFRKNFYGLGFRVEGGANFKPKGGNWSRVYYEDQDAPFYTPDYWSNDFFVDAILMNYFSHMNGSLYLGIGGGMVFPEGDNFYLNYTKPNETIEEGKTYQAFFIKANIGAEIKFSIHFQLFLELDAKFYPGTSNGILLGSKIGLGGWF